MAAHRHVRQHEPGHGPDRVRCAVAPPLPNEIELHDGRAIRELGTSTRGSPSLRTSRRAVADSRERKTEAARRTSPSAVLTLSGHLCRCGPPTKLDKPFVQQRVYPRRIWRATSCLTGHVANRQQQFGVRSRSSRCRAWAELSSVRSTRHFTFEGGSYLPMELQVRRA